MVKRMNSFFRLQPWNLYLCHPSSYKRREISYQKPVARGRLLHLFLKPVNTQKNNQQTATGPGPRYRYGYRSWFQGCKNAAINAGHRTEAAMANRILPLSTTTGLSLLPCFSWPRFNILGRNKIPRIMMTSTRISWIPENIYPPLRPSGYHKNNRQTSYLLFGNENTPIGSNSTK